MSLGDIVSRTDLILRKCVRWSSSHSARTPRSVFAASIPSSAECHHALRTQRRKHIAGMRNMQRSQMPQRTGYRRARTSSWMSAITPCCRSQSWPRYLLWRRLHDLVAAPLAMKVSRLARCMLCAMWATGSLCAHRKRRRLARRRTGHSGPRSMPTCGTWRPCCA